MGTYLELPRLTEKEARLLILQMVETVASRSTRVPVGLRFEAARRLQTVQRIIDDYLDVIALEMQDQLGDDQEEGT